MALNEKEKLSIIITNAIAAYSIYSKDSTISKNYNMIDFIIKSSPEDFKPLITMDLIDEIFEYISNLRHEQS